VTGTCNTQVTDYRWSDEKAGVRVWLRVPGVHKALRTAVRVRFRELSFDVAVADVGGVDYQFAVRALFCSRAERTRGLTRACRR
jgi:hypothetical protein